MRYVSHIWSYTAFLVLYHSDKARTLEPVKSYLTLGKVGLNKATLGIFSSMRLSTNNISCEEGRGGRGIGANSGGAWAPSAQKGFKLAEIIWSVLPQLSQNYVLGGKVSAMAEIFCGLVLFSWT